MKNTMKNIFYTYVGIMLLGLNNANALISPNGAAINNGIQGSAQTADQTIQGYIANFLTFLALIGIVYGLWGGFQILTAAGDEEKVKKGKTILIQVAIGLLVIFLANSIISFIITNVIGTVA